MRNDKREAQIHKTILTITVGMLIVYILTDWNGALMSALVVGIAGLFSNYAAKTIHNLWMKLTWLLSLIMPNILLSLVFYLIVVPTAFLARMFHSKDQLLLKNKHISLF